MKMSMSKRFFSLLVVFVISLMPMAAADNATLNLTTVIAPVAEFEVRVSRDGSSAFEPIHGEYGVDITKQGFVTCKVFYKGNIADTKAFDMDIVMNRFNHRTISDAFADTRLWLLEDPLNTYRTENSGGVVNHKLEIEHGTVKFGVQPEFIPLEQTVFRISWDANPDLPAGRYESTTTINIITK